MRQRSHALPPLEKACPRDLMDHFTWKGTPLSFNFQMYDDSDVWLTGGIDFPKPSVGTFKGRVIYDEVNNGERVKSMTYKAGDYVMGQGNICQIVYFYERNGKRRAHLKVFNRAEKTLLTDTADPHEIMDANECSNVNISTIEVIFYILSRNQDPYKQYFL